MAKKRIYNYIFHPGISYTDNLNPNAYFLLQQNKTFLQKEVREWIDEQVANAQVGDTFYNYTFNAAKCERDIGYAIDAYLFDLRYDGNSKTIETISLFWDGDVSQVDGNRQAEVEAHTFLKTLIIDYVIVNTDYVDSRQNIIVQVIDLTKTAESGTVTKLTTLLDDTTNIIENGLSVVPTLEEATLGFIKIQGNYTNADLLLITNTDRGEIIYNFSNPDLGGFLEYEMESDQDFPKFLDTTDTVTKINLFYDTSSASASDDLQIFTDDQELKVRPYDFGTDAIERMRIAPPLSMLDADFEYGLQPTKWSAIGTLRGYPSTYEVPGTELNVTTVLTDASAGTSGIGASLITVTTAGAHGLLAGDPFVIKALDLSVRGSARAEGTFIAVDILTPNQFTYYAKAKVGTTNGEELGTTFTILRKAGFYTGASIGNPVFSVLSQGSNGTLTAALNVTTGSDIIPFNDDAPELGSPLTGAGIEIGTQVTGIVGTGGSVASPDVTADANVGETTIQVSSATGIEPGLAIDRGDGFGVTVLNVIGTTVNLSGGLTSSLTGNSVDYTNLDGLPDNPNGFGAEFTISRAAGSYTIDAVTSTGSSYAVGDKILVEGIQLGGATSINDATIEITEVDSFGGVIAATITGTAFDGNATYSNVTGIYQHGNGSGAEFDVTYLNNAYTVQLSNPSYQNITGNNTGGNGTGALFDVTYTNNVYSVTVNAAGHTGYSVNDIVKVSGNDVGGTTPTNDLFIKVTGVDSTGSITSLNSEGTAPDGNEVYNDPAYTTSGTGVNAQFNVTTQGSTYEVTFSLNGTGYAQNDTITVLGSNLGGTSPTNDLIITIDTVDIGGEILTFTATGTALNTGSNTAVIGANISGSGASFDVTRNATAYEVTINSIGADYAVGQEILITGDNLGGTSPANDLTITIDTINSGGVSTFFNSIATISAVGTALPGTNNYVEYDALVISGANFPNGTTPANDIEIVVTGVGPAGNITNFSSTGTAPDATQTYSGVTGTSSGSGANATFNVQRDGTTYTPSIANIGQNYLAGETITILGSNLGGVDTTNDLVITVDTIDTGGEILTFSSAGTARNEDLTSGLNTIADPVNGTGAEFEVISLNGSYTVNDTISGSNYAVNQQIVIPGNFVGGATPDNDITITITAIGTTGQIQSFTFTGTAAGDSATYTGVQGANVEVTGNGAVFSVTRSAGIYSNLTITNSGTGYAPGNRLIIDGSNLGGASVINDIIIVVTEVDTSAGISNFTFSGTAVSGSNVDFISTISISEITTGSISTGDPISFSALATIEISFDSAHGLIPGSGFNVSIKSDNGLNNHNLANGPYIITSVPSANSLTYQARAPGAIDDTIDFIAGDVYPKSDAFFIHRPYDGGVQLGTGGPQHGAQAIRQSKKYIRYQSGKGIMYTTGALFAPSYDILSISSDGIEIGSTITITLDENDHGLQVGGVIRVLGIETPGYNHDYSVTDIIDERTFSVAAQYRLGSTDPIVGFGAQISTVTWNGAIVRSGIFDDQNGIFWEYDGSNLSVVQRTSTKQIAGTVAVSSDSNLITGTNTRFRDQLKAGDRIVIKGMTHVVSRVETQTVMTVTPDFRGVVDISGAKVCLVTDKKIKQSDFNLDRLDGTGPSKYNIDPAKMQMIGIQYSWYGAGFIDYMVRGADGNFVFAHRIRNSNVNTEAYMRSGNLPVRYEVTNEGATARLSEQVNDVQTTIPLDDASFFPANGGIVYIDNELISFTGVDYTNNLLTGCTRSANLVNYNAGAQRTYTAGPAIIHTERTGVVLVSNTITPLISHWGSSFITDGNFDEDRGYIFSYTEQSIPVSTTKQTAFLLRLAPSVSNAITGDLGERELLNRAQLLIQGIEITSDGVDITNSNAPITGGIVIEGILNPQNYPLNPSNIVWTGLGTEAQGGQPSFAQIAAGGSVQWSTGAVATQATISALTPIDGTAVTRYNSGNNNNVLYMRGPRRNNSLDDINARVGDKVVSTDGSATFAADTTITSIEGPYNNNDYYVVRISDRYSGPINSGETITFRRGDEDLNSRNFILADQISFNNSGATVGTDVVGTTAGTFPANTKISSIVEETFATTTYYRIIFNNTYSGTFTSTTGTITVEFVDPPFAQPGETIFSFIATPGERASLDLGQLKELTNTTLGGRGTFPNGPDVLAINVYKTSGTATTSNIILRWGEAQA